MIKILFSLVAFSLLVNPAFSFAICASDLTAPSAAGSGLDFGPWDPARNAKLIDLVIRNGIDFRPGDKVVVLSAHYQRPFAEAVTEELKRRGAGAVRAFYGIDRADVVKAIHDGAVAEEYVERHLPKAFVEELARENYSSINVGGQNEMGVPEGVSPERWEQFTRAVAVAISPYSRQLMAGQSPWTVIDLPTLLQASLVAPELPAAEALDLLKKMISDTYWLDQPDPSALWKASSERIEARGAKLDALRIKKLHYVGSGSDFTVELHARARWEGGRMRAGDRTSQPNFPTFENYVTPMYRSTNGIVKVQRPVPVQNTLVRGAWFKFEKGRVVDYGADEGLEALDRFFNQDLRNRFLGEVALVDEDSPVNKQARPFYSILFDENALSHIALGAGYSTTFAEPIPASEADYEAVQMNSPETLGHTDFMIGSPELNITAETYDGQILPIMMNGKIVLPK